MECHHGLKGSSQNHIWKNPFAENMILDFKTSLQIWDMVNRSLSETICACAAPWRRPEPEPERWGGRGPTAGTGPVWASAAWTPSRSPPAAHQTTTTTTLSQSSNNNTVTIIKQQHCHNHQTTALSQSSNNNNTVTITKQPHCHNHQTTTLSQSSNNHTVTIIKQQQHCHNHQTTTLSQSSNNNTVTSNNTPVVDWYSIGNNRNHIDISSADR